MKKIFVKLLKSLLVLVVLIIVVLILLYLIMPLKFDKIEKCNDVKKLVAEKDGVYIYSYCMSNIRVRKGFGTISLENYIDSNDNWYKKIKPLISFPTTQGKKGLSYEAINYKILECNTEKNKNIYISPLYGIRIDVDCEKVDEPIDDNVDVEFNN